MLARFDLTRSDGVMIHAKVFQCFFLILLIVMLAGCGSTESRKEVAKKPHITDAQRAAQYAASGMHAEAATIYRQLAIGKSPPERQSLLLKAADNLMLAGDLNAVDQLLSSVDCRVWPDLLFKQQLLIAEHRMAANRGGEALSLLVQLTPTNISHEMEVRYREDRAAAYRIAGNRLESAGQLTELDLILREAESRLRNQRAIIAVLVELPDTTLELLQPQPAGILGGWMELARMVKRARGDARRLANGMPRWREAFPNHPALPQLFAEGYAIQTPSTRKSGSLAVMLPLSGRYHELGSAVRDGLLSAYYADTARDRPELRFFDTNTTPSVNQLYEEIVSAGFDLVLGPLRKEAVEELASRHDRRVPIIALNWLPASAQVDNLYQFGLAPEDEARQVADRAWADGYSTGIVLTPADEWGERVYAAFLQCWEQLGGVVPEHQTYAATDNDFSAPLKSILNIDESEARHQELQRILGKRVKFEPRVRSDAGFIFLVGKTQLVRQLRPQLQFQHAASLPVYSTSQVYSGRPDQKADVDLEGVIFPDIPWLLLYEGDQDPLARDGLNEMFAEGGSRHPRLYAMGSDLYEILRNSHELIQGDRFILDGKTGVLSLDAKNRIIRRLVWAKFEQGVPKVLGYGEAPRSRLSPEQPPVPEQNNMQRLQPIRL